MTGTALIVRNRAKLFCVNSVRECFTENVPKPIIFLKKNTGNVHHARCELLLLKTYLNTESRAPFTLLSIFGTARIKLVPVPRFWFLDYLFR
jgi:hypothetical protein